MRRLVKFIIRISIILFIALNAIVIMHAYKFTHFDEKKTQLSRTSTNLTFEQKIVSLIMGVSMPKPKIQKLPAYPYQVIQIASNTTLEAWLSQVPKAKGTVILGHGYGGEKSSLNNVAAHFQSMGYNTLQLDFMGAGNSSSNKCTIGYKEAENIKDALLYLESKGYSNFIGFGASMGAVALLRATAEYKLPFDGLIIECPFGSMLETVKARFDIIGVSPTPMAEMLTFWGGVINGFNAFSHNAVDYAQKVNIPTLLMSGDKDEYVKLSEIDAVYQNLAGVKKKHILKNAKHENYNVRFADEWAGQVKPFLKQLK